LSIHGNAHANQNANYFSVWTSKGQTKADAIADLLFDELQKEFPTERFSTELADKDKDWEANFKILSETNCPAVLSENGFFTNYEQAKKMLTAEWKEKVAAAHFKTILKLVQN
jgi:N-acetylmuramoyl-L-alanine amidase